MDAGFRGGRLVLKGGEALHGVEKKKMKKKAKPPSTDADSAGAGPTAAAVVDPKTGKTIDPLAVNVQSGKAYEEEFEFEKLRRAEPKVKNTPWGSTYRAPPEILHGYDKVVTGKTAGERLDLRAASKADKHCK